MAHHEQDDMTVREIPGSALAGHRLAGARARGRGDRRPGNGGCARSACTRATSTTAGRTGRSSGASSRAGEHDGVVIFGSSRILFDTDLDVWEEMTGPPADPARAGRHQSAAAPGGLRRSDDRIQRAARRRRHAGPLFLRPLRLHPAVRRADGLLARRIAVEALRAPGRPVLSQHLAFLDEAYRARPLIERIDIPDRADVRAALSGRLEALGVIPRPADPHVAAAPDRRAAARHARLVWGPFDGSGPKPESDRARDRGVAGDVAKIRARGGEVVFVRAPSAGLYYEHEHAGVPRARTWDPLLAKTGAFGIHFEDYPEMRGLEVPEWSHLSRGSADALHARLRRRSSQQRLSADWEVRRG